VKEKYGRKMCLKGNVHTIETMLNGTERAVEQEVKRCINDASEGGGYVLSTGDQVPHMTPEENFVAFIKAGRKWGKYS
jgi:uroporphyrinogen-III decarboxylase